MAIRRLLSRHLYPEQGAEPDKLLRNIHSQTYNSAKQKEQLSLLGRVNDSYSEQVGRQPELEAGIQAMEVAFRMQTEASAVSTSPKKAKPREPAMGAAISAEVA